MKKTFIILTVIIIASSAWAIPAKPGIVRLTATDGSTIEAELVGDEFHHCFRSLDGYVVKQAEENCYLKTNEKFDAQAVAEKRQMAKARREIVRMPKGTDMVTANFASKGLVILVGFSDKAFTHTNEAFTNMLNQQGYNFEGATGSAKEYFNASSYGKYNPTFDVYGPYTLDNTMSYYGTNDHTGFDQRPDQMVVDAVAKLVAAEGQNVLQDYDCDNDGNVDNVFVFYAGYAESSGASPNTIWPHRWIIYPNSVTGTVTYGGKTIYDYACSSELADTYGSKLSGIGAFCHEFSHVLGLPDLYDTNGNYAWATPYDWDLMDNGCYNNNQKTPPTYSAQERFYLNWLTPTVLTDHGTYTLDNVNVENGEAYMITSSGQSDLNPANPSPKSYYLLENRQKSGWDAYLPGHGMLVWKINFSNYKWESNTVNNNRSSLGCMIVAAGGDIRDSYGYYISADSDPFPGTKRVRKFTAYTNYALSDITESNGQISFSLGQATDVENISCEEGPVILREKVIGGKVRIERLKEGMTIMLIDAMGRVIRTVNADSDVMEFDAPDNIYFIKIL